MCRRQRGRRPWHLHCWCRDETMSSGYGDCDTVPPDGYSEYCASAVGISGQTVLDLATISSPYQGSTATAAGNHGICGSDDAPDLGVSYELAPGPCGKEGISPGRHPSIVLRQKQIIAEASRTPTPANQQSLCISCLTGFIRTVKEASN